MNAREIPIPDYYNRKFEKLDPKRLEQLKRLRRARANERPEENTSRRRRTREVVALAKLNLRKKET